MFSKLAFSLCILLFHSSANASRYGLLRVSEPSKDLSSQPRSSESGRFLQDEDFQILYRGLFYQAGSTDELSMAGLSLTAGLSLPMPQISMVALSFDPAGLSFAPLSMAPFSMAGFSMIDSARAETIDDISAGADSGIKVDKGAPGYDNNKDSTQGTTSDPSSTRSNTDATLTGALSALGVALVVGAVAFKMKRSVAAALSEQSVVSDEASVPSLPTTV